MKEKDSDNLNEELKGILSKLDTLNGVLNKIASDLFDKEGNAGDGVSEDDFTQTPNEN